MASYAIGDLQACLGALEALLRHIDFSPSRDRLLFCGDLIGRGPQAVDTLRFIRSLGSAALTVLGNHDLHLLAVAERGERPKPDDRLDELLDAADAELLLDWLRRQRLAWHSPEHQALLVHAGLAPQWTVAQTLALAAEVEAVLGDRQAGARLLREMRGDEPRRWSDELRGIDRQRCIINILSRARVCSAAGDFDYRFKRAATEAPPGLMPWFAVPGRQTADCTVIFGHWSTLGRIHWQEHRVYGLDSGYIWGGQLSALRLEDFHLFQIAASPRETISPF